MQGLYEGYVGLYIGFRVSQKLKSFFGGFLEEDLHYIEVCIGVSQFLETITLK